MQCGSFMRHVYDAFTFELSMLHLIWVAFTIWFPSSSRSFLTTFLIEQATIQSYYSLVGLCWLALSVIAATFVMIVLQGVITLTELSPSLRLASASQAPFALPTSTPTVVTESAASAPNSRLRWWPSQSTKWVIWNWTLITYKNIYILTYPNEPTLKTTPELITKAFADAQALFRAEGYLLLTVCFLAGLLGWLDMFRLMERIRIRNTPGDRKPPCDAEAALWADAKENDGAEKAKQVPVGILVEVKEVLETTEKAGIHSQVLVHI